MHNPRLGLVCSVEVESVRHVPTSQSLLSKGYTYTELFRTETALNMLSIGNAGDSRKIPQHSLGTGLDVEFLSNIINIKQNFLKIYIDTAILLTFIKYDYFTSHFIDQLGVYINDFASKLT